MKDSTKKALKITGKVLNAVFLTVLSIVLVFCLYTIFSRLVLKNNLPKVFGYSNAVVVSGSMGDYPAVWDMVIMKEQDDYAVGDIITYRKDNIFVTHRIIEKTGDTFITKGDANPSPDAPISADVIEGKVVAVVKQVGKFINFIRKPAGIICIVSAIALIMLVSYIVSKRKVLFNKKGN